MFRQASCSKSSQRQDGDTDSSRFTRLLDLTLGWGEHVENDETVHPDSVHSADIYDACQSVAIFAEPYWDATPEAQEMAVRRFVDIRLLPLLFGKSKP